MHIPVALLWIYSIIHMAYVIHVSRYMFMYVYIAQLPPTLLPPPHSLPRLVENHCLNGKTAHLSAGPR